MAIICETQYLTNKKPLATPRMYNFWFKLSMTLWNYCGSASACVGIISLYQENEV